MEAHSHESGTPLVCLAVSGAVAGTIVYPPGGHFGPRVQQDLQLVLLHTGEMRVWVDDALRIVPPGHVALLMPGHRERFVFAESEETWHRWIAVSISSGLTPSERERLEGLPFQLPLSEPMNRLTDVLLACQPDRPSGDPLLRMLGLSALLLYEQEALREPGERAMHPAVLLAKHTVHERYAEELTLGDLAAAAQVTEEHLVRLFRRYERTTPMRFVWEVRCRRGADLLRSTGLSVAQVAARCGFQTSYHFARTVKRVLGRTPTELRRASWGGGV